jgi:undecaprenyl diphosphate synthase
LEWNFVTQSGSLHAAIIMDGNGRWAERRGLARSAGHYAGTRAVEAIIEGAPAIGVGTLTLYAFSSDNWRRPMPEVSGLMRLFRGYLRSHRERAVANGVSVEVIGRRDRLPGAVVKEIAAIEAATAPGQRLRVRLAIDYSARDAILRAAARLPDTPTGNDREQFADLLATVDHGRGAVPPVDFLIRTGGEQRLSDFLLWECAYAELFFRDTMWPDFTAGELDQVVTEFRRRERRFGAIPVTAAARATLRLSR